jgi:hypothetical protein
MLVGGVFILVTHFDRDTSLGARLNGMCRNGKRAAHQAGDRSTSNHRFLCHVDLSFTVGLLPQLPNGTIPFENKANSRSTPKASVHCARRDVRGRWGRFDSGLF